MTMHALYSVLISNYNNGKYIDDAVDSVLNQTYPNWEIIIVDDCSTDNSQEVYSKYVNIERIKIYYNKKNSGRGYTKQQCFNFSNGEICSFLDADDKLVSNALETMVSAHVKNPQCSLIYSTHYNFNNYGIIDISENNGDLGQANDFVITSNSIISHLVSFKRDAFLKTKGIDCINMADDVDLYLKLEEVGDIFFINEPLYYYRVDNSNSACRTVSKNNSNYITSKVFLNAFNRRISTNSPLFTSKIDKYYSAIDYWFQLYLDNSKKMSFEKLYYIIIYLKSIKVKPSAMMRIIKSIIT